MNQRPEGIFERLERTVASGHLVGLSSITLHELWLGIHRSTRVDFNAARLDAFWATLDIHLFNETAAEQVGLARAILARAGTPTPTPTGPYDILIAGHALALYAVLVTNNTGEFGRVAGRTVEDWTA